MQVHRCAQPNLSRIRNTVVERGRTQRAYPRKQKKSVNGRKSVPNADSSEALKWLESLSAQIANLGAYRQLVEPQLASEFNVLLYARTDEMGLSKILADLLDPKGPHGQGDGFLKCFLKQYWPERDWPDQASIGAHVNVRTEAATDRIAQSKRRIDIPRPALNP